MTTRTGRISHSSNYGRGSQSARRSGGHRSATKPVSGVILTLAERKWATKSLGESGPEEASLVSSAETGTMTNERWETALDSADTSDARSG